MAKTVLIVEDEYLIAMDLKAMVERGGWRVLGPVPSVEAALRLIEEELPSAALLDVNLGDEMITRLAETLKSRAVPFAVASAYWDPARFGGDVLTGAPNVGKPAVERHLLATLAELAGTAA